SPAHHASETPHGSCRAQRRKGIQRKRTDRACRNSSADGSWLNSRDTDTEDIPRKALRWRPSQPRQGSYLRALRCRSQHSFQCRLETWQAMAHLVIVQSVKGVVAQAKPNAA